MIVVSGGETHSHHNTVVITGPGFESRPRPFFLDFLPFMFEAIINPPPPIFMESWFDS